MSRKTVLARLNEEKGSCPTPSAPVQFTSSSICIKQEYFENQLPTVTRTIKTESSESPLNEHNIMQLIKVEVKEEHYDDQDCVVKCELDFDEGEQMDRKIKVEDVSSGKLVQHCKCVKKEEEGGEYLMVGNCKDCEICRMKMEMKDEPEQSGFETELGGNSGLAIEGGTRVKKEEEDGEVQGERPNKIQRMDRLVWNVPVGSPSSNVIPTNVEYVDDQVASTLFTNPITFEDHTQPYQPVTFPLLTSIVTQTQSSSSSAQHVNEDGNQSFEQRQESQDTSAAGGQQVQQVLTTENFVKRIEPADELGNRFECDYRGCGRRMKLKENLIRHIRSHTGEKRFKCTVAGCDRAFVQNSDLKSHLNVHSGDRPFVCSWPRCDARFGSKSNLTVHLRTHTGERPFGCDQCDATFTHHSNLVTHLRTHTGARPFVCTWPECGQTFTQLNHLKTHSFVHSNERQFVCDVRGCTKVYKRKDALLRHQMAKHN